jgi:hypothetical protein
MSISLKSASLGVAMLAAAIVTAANARADAGTPMQQVAQIAGAAAGAVTLPEVMVHPSPQPGWYYDPYTSGRAQRPSSLNHIPFQHYNVPAGYDAAVAMHPYTSGFGPCIMGATPAQGCRHPTGDPVPPFHYERPPFNQ